ncbi:MAG: hypothetical protein LAT54_09125, partial [Cryomorphaceae bacterium]|nr:hypothetical protein [Cryomorphaceae bacterium]
IGDIKSLLKRYRLFIVLSVLLTGIAATFGALSISPTYRSVATVYPINLENFSNESPTEQMMQWLRGRNVMDMVVDSFDLHKTWKLDKNSRQYEHELTKKYNRSIRFKKTLYESVDIDVRMDNPEMAKHVANGIVHAFNQVVRDEWRNKYREQVENFERVIALKNKEIDSAQNIHSQLSKTYEILDYEVQAKEVSRGYLGTVDASSGRLINQEGIKRLKENLELKGGHFLRNHARLVHLMEELTIINRDYAETLRMYNSENSYASLVSRPIASDKPYSPIVWMFTLTGMLGGLVLSLLVVFWREGGKQSDA